MNTRKLTRALPPAAQLSSDLRQTALDREAEDNFREALKPGCGRPSNAADLAISPDGTQIAFTGTLLEKLEGAPATRICIARVQTSELRVVSFGPNSDAMPFSRHDRLRRVAGGLVRPIHAE